jgi:ABC-type antimicrobial peptide transport system permease subunit
MTAALIGVVIGMTSALGLARLLTRFLFGVAPHDAAVFTIVPITLAVVTLVAVWIPARRATRIEPIRALRF